MNFETWPEAVNLMERLGNWEANTMTGKGHQVAMVNLGGQEYKYRASMGLWLVKSPKWSPNLTLLYWKH